MSSSSTILRYADRPTVLLSPVLLCWATVSFQLTSGLFPYSVCSVTQWILPCVSLWVLSVYFSILFSVQVHIEVLVRCLGVASGVQKTWIRVVSVFCL